MKRRLKQVRRELKKIGRENRKAEASYFTKTIGDIPVISVEPIPNDEEENWNEDEEINRNEDEDIDELVKKIDETLKRSMKILPHFSGMNYENGIFTLFNKFMALY